METAIGTALTYLATLRREVLPGCRPALSASAFMLVLACAVPLHAQGIVYKTGNDLLDALRQATGLEHAYALNYIVGVVDATNGNATRKYRTWPNVVNRVSA